MLETEASPLTKVCTGCGVTKPLDDFTTRVDCRGQRVPHPRCRRCVAAHVRARRATDPTYGYRRDGSRRGYTCRLAYERVMRRHGKG